MKFFALKDFARSWSVWVLTFLGAFSTADFSGIVDAVVPEHWKPVVYAGASFVGLLVRSIKQKG